MIQLGNFSNAPEASVYESNTLYWPNSTIQRSGFRRSDLNKSHTRDTLLSMRAPHKNA